MKVTKTVIFAEIRKTIDKRKEIYIKGVQGRTSIVSRIAKITKFTKTEIYNNSRDHGESLCNLGHAADLFLSTGIPFCESKEMSLKT